MLDRVEIRVVRSGLLAVPHGARVVVRLVLGVDVDVVRVAGVAVLQNFLVDDLLVQRILIEVQLVVVFERSAGASSASGHAQRVHDVRGLGHRRRAG